MGKPFRATLIRKSVFIIYALLVEHKKVKTDLFIISKIYLQTYNCNFKKSHLRFYELLL